MAQIRSKKGNYRATVLVSADIMLSIVCISTYFIDCELNFISLFFMETLNIPHIHLGIYNSKLTCFRSIFIILGCLTEYGIYKICNRFKLEEKHPKYREGLSVFFLFALCVVRIILTLILYFSKQLRLHLYIILNVEAFYFGIFQTSLISLAMDHSGDIKLINYLLSTTIKLIQLRINRSESNKPMLFLKINFFICIGLSIISLIMWPVYLFRLHKPLYQYDEYILFVKTRINTIILHSEECIEILNDVKKLMEKINMTECDEKNKNGGGTGSTTGGQKDSNNGKDSRRTENGESENIDEQGSKKQGEHSETTDDDIDDVIITTTEKQDSNGVDNSTTNASGRKNGDIEISDGKDSKIDDEYSEKDTYSNESKDTESDPDDEIGSGNREDSENESQSDETDHGETDDEEEEIDEEINSKSGENDSENEKYSSEPENEEPNETEDDNDEDSESETNTTEDKEESEDEIVEESTSTEEEDSNNEKNSATVENGESENIDEQGSKNPGEHSETTDDDIDDVIITTTEKQDSNGVDNSNKTKNKEMCVDNKLITEVFVLLNEMNDSKLYYTATNIMNKNSHMEFDPRKHKEFYELSKKEIELLLDVGGKIRVYQSGIKRLRKKMNWKSHEIKENLNNLKIETNKALDYIKKLNQASKNFNEQIKKIAHKNLKWALSTMLMIIPTTIIFYFLFDGVLPHAIIIDEESKHIVVMTSLADFLGTMPPVVMTSKKHEYRYWTWENSCFWIAVIPQIAVLVSAILAIHSKISYFKFIIDVPFIVLVMCTILGICHGLMESTSFFSITNHVHFHSADPDDIYLVIIQIVLRIYLKYISLKLSACYNEARISLGFFRPDFYTFLEVGSLEAFMITVKETFRRFFFDLFFDIRVNINQFI
ncbi:uncharacterized protein TA10655 [Theileria annulata]|uniref:Uncharacterized protein n=1 Tax=Theileria annulata TaxID=5874 RepID=Q4U930_THEAN|nr:uncharacterized protein TA10655 [Theileria annulata]CAI76673.1 hypothetical protein, conserved [Theileria annulata]|eukprot:XP_953298.1 hypothetical protein, conserved [Theileria annulata]